MKNHDDKSNPPITSTGNVDPDVVGDGEPVDPRGDLNTDSEDTSDEDDENTSRA